MKRLLFPLLMTILLTAGVQAQKVGVLENSTDIGAVKYQGETVYDENLQSYTLSGSGKNMWFGEDELHYAFTSIQGDFIVRARVAFVGEGVDPHRKVGWEEVPTLCLRQNLENLLRALNWM